MPEHKLLRGYYIGLHTRVFLKPWVQMQASQIYRKQRKRYGDFFFLNPVLLLSLSREHFFSLLLLYWCPFFIRCNFWKAPLGSHLENKWGLFSRIAWWPLHTGKQKWTWIVLLQEVLSLSKHMGNDNYFPQFTLLQNNQFLFPTPQKCKL